MSAVIRTPPLKGAARDVPALLETALSVLCLTTATLSCITEARIYSKTDVDDVASQKVLGAVLNISNTSRASLLFWTRQCLSVSSPKVSSALHFHIPNHSPQPCQQLFLLTSLVFVHAVPEYLSVYTTIRDQ